MSADRATGFHDRQIVAAEPLRRAPRAGEILGADPLVHACAMVVARQQVLERIIGVALGAIGQLLRAPGFAHQAGGAVAVAFGQQRAGERETCPWR
ncbi:hypothetical protein QIH80_20745 [Bradyrhizobium elkanii]|nr:hypothetical protein QIH80_20745 [Bradyrhizobium elkanii]